MNSSTTAPGPTFDFGLLLPRGWTRLDLEPATRRGRIEKLVGNRWTSAQGGTDLATLADVLTRFAAEARRSGADRAWFYSEALSGRPVSATLLTSFWRSEDESGVETVEDIAERFRTEAASSGRATGVSIVDLPAGRAVRLRRRNETPPDIGEPDLAAETVQYFLPTGSRAIVLAFSSLAPALADEFAELFDAIAATLHWRKPQVR